IDGHFFSRLSEAERLEYLAVAAADGYDIVFANLTWAQQAKLAETTPLTLRKARRLVGGSIRPYTMKKQKQAKPVLPAALRSFKRLARAMGSEALLNLAARFEREELAAQAAAAARTNGHAGHRNGNGAAVNR